MAQQREVARYGMLGQFIANAVKVGDTIYVSGMVSIDDDGNVLDEGDVVAQTRNAYEHVKDALGRLDGTMDDIVDESLYVTDVANVMENVEAVWAARAEAYGRDPDVTQTMVEVSSLVFPGLMIEIKCTARV